MGEAVSAVQQGEWDTEELFPDVVALVRANGNTVRCSGTLITPRWVLTAAHCFTSDDANLDVNGDFDVLVGWQIGADMRRVRHERASSGPVLVRSFAEVDPASDDDISRDIAVFRLDDPVGLSEARPRHPELSVAACGEGFEAAQVGFGGGNFDLAQPTACPAPDPRVRRFQFASNWGREIRSHGMVYDNEWPVLYDSPCLTYPGHTNGDSGGALIDRSGRLCGVISSQALGWPFPGGAMFTNTNAAVDSAQTIQWLSTARTPEGYGVLDAQGNWDGDCERMYRQCDLYGNCDWVDQDHDGVSDHCDNCPRIWNPEQTRIDDDPDGDGKGAACDLCPDQGGHEREPWLFNCNYGAELGIAFPETDGPPAFIGVDEYTPPANAGLMEYYRAAFQPDACDPVPCPAMTFEDNTGTMPEADAPIESCPLFEPVTGCNCEISEPFTTCDWAISNVVTLAPQAGNDSLHQAGDPIDVGLRWCDCPHQLRTGLGVVDARCQRAWGCRVDANLYHNGQGNPWKKLETYVGDTSNTELGAEFTLPLLAPAWHGEPLSVRWRFIDLIDAGFGGEEQADLDWQPGQIHGPAGPVRRWVDGVLWASIQNSPHPQVFRRSLTYAAGNGRMSLTKTEELGAWAATDDWYLRKFCPGCPQSFSWLLAKVNDPLMYRATASGLVADLSVSPDMRHWYEQAALGETLLVEAAEPLGTLAAAAQPGAAMLRAVALDRATTTVSSLLSSVGLGAPIVEVDVFPLPGSPVLEGDEAVVLSGMVRRVAVLGGTVGGVGGGEPEPMAWLLDVDTNVWAEWELPPEQRPGRVLGATFRAEDLSYYLVDERSGTVRLRRWRPGEEVETLATLPAAWAELDRSWLVSGHAGDLVFAASAIPAEPGGPTEQSLVARFFVSDSGQLAFAGMAHQDVPVLAAPAVTHVAIAFVTSDPSGGMLGQIRLDELGPAPPGEEPILVGWTDDAIVGLNSVWLTSSSTVQGGVAVIDASSGPVLAGSAELVLGPKALVSGGVRADTLRLKAKTSIVGSAAYNELRMHRRATIDGATQSPLALPLGLAIPHVPDISWGGSDVTVAAGDAVELAPDGYGAVVLEPGTATEPSVLTLSGGSYGFEQVAIGAHGRLECAGPCGIRVVGRLSAGRRSHLGAASEALSSADVEIYVEGLNGSSGGLYESPSAAAFGADSTIGARLFVPYGTLWLGKGVDVTGTLVGRDVRLGPHAHVTAGGS